MAKHRHTSTSVGVGIAWLLLITTGFALAQVVARTSSPSDAGITSSDAQSDARADTTTLEASSARDAGPGDATLGVRSPPVILNQPRIVYPATGDGARVDVELAIVIGVSGDVISTSVLGHVPASAPVIFEQVAEQAARTIQFRPATQDGEPIVSRVRYHMVVEPPMMALDADTPELGDIDGGTEGVEHAHLVADAGVAVDAAVADAAGAEADAGAAETAQMILVRGHGDDPRGPSDNNTQIGALREVPNNNAQDMIRAAAPGIFLVNEGGEGHAASVFLRGFNAGEGQDLEFTVQGIPVNEVGSPHGEGRADLNFVIPELVKSIRTVEGPFDPRQGNYAVAGSAQYQLGLEKRGLWMRYMGGSFNTHRLVSVWSPAQGRAGTFAGLDLRSSDGFGSNRYSQLARAMGQVEVSLGPNTTMQVLAQSYIARYGVPGVVRQDDFARNPTDATFFGTYDPTQGGLGGRHGVGITFEHVGTNVTARQLVFAHYRHDRLRLNYTGFVEDPPTVTRTGVSQRGDALDETMGAFTVGGRGSLRLTGNWLGQAQALELGYFTRFDHVSSAIKRLRYLTEIPYRTESDLESSITNVGAYIDAQFKPTAWLLVRGGVRGDLFAYDVLNRCDLHDTFLGAGTTVLDTLCYSRDRSGVRDPQARRSTAALIFQPRVSVQFGPWQGVSFAGSFGMGARAADPSSLADNAQTPFSPITSGEAGVVFQRTWGATSLQARGVYYHTVVGRDLIFNQQQGRNTLAPGTRRQGMMLAGRLTGSFLDVSMSLTYAHARFEREANDPGGVYFPADSGDIVPYVPPWVFRTDASVFGALPKVSVWGRSINLRGALGITYVSPRPLLFGQWSDPVFVTDLSAGVRIDPVEVGVIVQNLFDTRYRLGEYNYVSNFVPNNPTPDMVTSRHFVAGPPFGIFGTLTLHFGGNT